MMIDEKIEKSIDKLMKFHEKMLYDGMRIGREFLIDDFSKDMFKAMIRGELLKYYNEKKED